MNVRRQCWGPAPLPAGGGGEVSAVMRVWCCIARPMLGVSRGVDSSATGRSIMLDLVRARRATVQ